MDHFGDLFILGLICSVTAYNFVAERVFDRLQLRPFWKDVIGLACFAGFVIAAVSAVFVWSELIAKR
jgi:hypothetical protein